MPKRHQQLELVICRSDGPLLSEQCIVHAIPMMGDEPPTEFRVLPAGPNHLSDGPVYTLYPDDIGPVVDAFNKGGIDFQVDYEHASEMTGADIPAHGAPAAAWGKLEARNDGIWLTNIRWVPPADEYVRSGKYRYFSPTFARTEDNRIVGIKSAGLTNQPRITHLQPLTRAKVVPFHEYPLDESDTWDAAREKKAWRKACSADGSGEWDEVDKHRYAQMFAYVADGGEHESDYKLPHHTVAGGKLRTSKKGVEAAAGAIGGARGGVKIPAEDLSGVKRHLADHYLQFHEKAPWDRTTETAKASDLLFLRNGRSRQRDVVARVAAFNADGHLLMGRRADSGKWTHPGGHANPDESPQDAAGRELKEEAGLDAQSLEPIAETTAGTTKLHLFKATVSGEPTAEHDPDHEFDSFRWVDPKQPFPADMPLHYEPDAVVDHLKSQGHFPAEQPAAPPPIDTQATAEENDMDTTEMTKLFGEHAKAMKDDMDGRRAMHEEAKASTATLCSSIGALCKAMEASAKREPDADDQKKQEETKRIADEQAKATEKARKEGELEACKGFVTGSVGTGFTMAEAKEVIAKVETGAMSVQAANAFVTAKRSHGAVREAIDAGAVKPPVITFGFDQGVVERCKAHRITTEVASKLTGADVTPQRLDEITTEVCRTIGVAHVKHELGEVVVDYDPAKCVKAWEENRTRFQAHRDHRTDMTFRHGNARAAR